MKKSAQYLLVLMVVSLALNGCNLYQHTNRRQETKIFSIDFREYAAKGFLFMPGEYYGEYEVMGIIRAELHPSVSYVTGSYPRGEGYTVYQFFSSNKRISKVTRNIYIEELIEYVYDLAIDWGGDAFSNFETSIETGLTDRDVNTSYPYYVISGIVIKRK